MVGNGRVYYRRKEPQGLLLFPMTSRRRNFPRLVLLDSVTTGRNRENGFGSSGCSRRRERNLTSTALLEFQRRPKRDSRFFSSRLASSLVKISTATSDELKRLTTTHRSIERNSMEESKLFSETRFEILIDFA